MDKIAKENKSRFEIFLKKKLRIGMDTGKYATSLDVKMRKVAADAGESLDSLYSLTDTAEVMKLRSLLSRSGKMVYNRLNQAGRWDDGLKWYEEFLLIPTSLTPMESGNVVSSSPVLSTTEEEGKHVTREQIIITRNRDARAKSIQHYGCWCQACGIKMQDIYGSLGESYIEVHHRKPIHLFDDTHVVDPIEDLIPLCPNCHAMIHKLKDVSDIDTLRRIIQEYKP